MLILGRCKDDRVVITVGDVRITVSVCEIRGERVRLGFDAPPEVTVNRGEIQTLVDRDGQRRVAR